MLVFYLPVAIGGFIVFGGKTQNIIIDNLNKNWINTTILVLITGHLLTAYNIILNPVFQGLEQVFNAPTSKKKILKNAFGFF
jgi:vesicular inhibitory amino acid transporter